MTDAVPPFEIVISVAAAVTLFVYALKGFSHDVQEAGGEWLADRLRTLTRNPFNGFVLGAVLTAIVQSSSAVSGITVALVESGTFLFRGSLPVFLGANVGTTSTAWLVTLDATILGPFLIVASVVISIIPFRIAIFGRAIFYLGVILLALNLVGDYVGPLKSNPQFAEWMVYAQAPAIGLLVGIVGTALLQSSSVLVGLAVIAVQQGLMPTETVVPIIIGSNLGTTSTALLASLGMGIVAKRAALSNLIFNAVGVLIFLPFMGPFAQFVIGQVGEGDVAVATTHLLFNIAVAIVGALIIPLIVRWLDPGVGRTIPQTEA